MQQDIKQLIREKIKMQGVKMEIRPITLKQASNYLICTLIPIYLMGPTKGKSNLGMGTEEISRNL